MVKFSIFKYNEDRHLLTLRFFNRFVIIFVDDNKIVTDALQTLLQWKAEEGAEASAPAAFDVSEGIDVVQLEKEA